METQDQGKPVSSMFERIQTLQNENRDLTAKLSVLTATDSQVRRLTEKSRSLEENEDSLMEKVFELEDEVDGLKRQLSKYKQGSSSVTELEENIYALQENEKEMNVIIDTLKLKNERLLSFKDEAVRELKDKLENTQRKLEELQTVYDNECKIRSPLDAVLFKARYCIIVLFLALLCKVLFM